MSSLMRQRPRLTSEQAAEIAGERFGIQATARELPSERDQNFLLTRPSGQQEILKISNGADKLDCLELQTDLLDRLASSGSRFEFPTGVTALDGAVISTIETESGSLHYARVLSWVEGDPLASVRPQGLALLQELGEMLGTVSRALEGFWHPGTSRSLKWDLAVAPDRIRRCLGLIEPAPRRTLLECLLERYEQRILPQMDSLRRSVIHNDVNDYNVIVGPLEEADSPWPERRIVGLIDLGDALESWTVAEPAVGIAYAMLGRVDPLAAAAAVTTGYHRVYPLQEDEIPALFGLATLRLCLSVCNSAEQRADDPANEEYLSISEPAAWETLERLETIDPRFACYRLRHACDLEPCPTASGVRTWLREHRDAMAPLVEPDLRHAYVFDLSVGSTQMGGGAPGTFETGAVTDRLFGQMRQAGAAVGIGRYDEARCWYGGDLFAAPSDEAPRRRTVHLGIDVFLEPGSPVFAPLDGRVRIATVNAGHLDYGPTLVLEHEPEPGLRFYTLYGHLGSDAMRTWGVGDLVARGSRLATIGAPPDNGDWAPHLHFQIIVDLLGNETDFPGVAAPDERPVWLSMCPDPALILDLPQEQPATVPAQGIVERRQSLLGPSLSTAYHRPLQIVRGFGSWLYDELGQPYLDAVNNVAHVGHSHPLVVAAANRHNEILNTNTRYLHDNLVRYAEQLVAMLPDPLSVCTFVCSGSEANELALRMARTHTGRDDVVVLEGAYHGNTTTLIQLSPYKHAGPGGSGAPDWVHVATMPDPYRARLRRSDPATGPRLAASVREACEQAPGGIAAFFAEPLLGCGGQIVPPPGYLPAAFSHVRENGGVCIADEVQIGFGRVGEAFWAFESQAAVPDIVTLGKPIGNGYPLAAVVTTPEIAASFDNGMEYFNTFGGNPVACAVGLAVLEVIETEQLQANALRIGDQLLQGMRQLMRRHPIIGDVRGAGLFLGIELVRDRESLEPADSEAQYVVNRLRDRGILISTDGPLHNVLKIKPPMCFSEHDADRLLAALEAVLQEDFPRSVGSR